MADTYPHTFRVVLQSVQPTEHRLPVLLPPPLAEDYFQEVPGPANQRDFQELVFGEHFGTLHEEEDVALIIIINKTNQEQELKRAARGRPLTPKTPYRSHMVQPHRKSISKLWLRMMMTCSLPNLSTVAWSVYRVQSVPDHHSSSITSSAQETTKCKFQLLFLFVAQASVSTTTLT